MKKIILVHNFNDKDFSIHKVSEFLYDGQPKLFRSATEGNFIIKVMDVSLTPNATLGRRIVSFTATAYEIAECTVENFKKYNILEGIDE